MKKVLSLLLVLSFTTFSLASPGFRPQEPAQTPSGTNSKPSITNKDVLEMTKSGLATEIIIAKIKGSPSDFDTTPGTLADLKTAGVSDSVILAMLKGPADVAPAATAAVEMEVKVADGTEVEITLQNTLSGQEAKIGDIVDFSVVRDVQVDGITIFERDASGRARVTTAKKSGRWGKAGKLEWAMQDLQAADGNRIPARFSKRELGDSKGGTVAVAAVATTVLLGPFGLLWGLKKGKAAIIPAGNRYTVFVHGDTKVRAKVPTNAMKKL